MLVIVIHLNNLADLLAKQSRVDEARNMLDQAPEIFRATLPPEHPYITGTETHIANLPASE